MSIPEAVTLIGCIDISVAGGRRLQRPLLRVDIFTLVVVDGNNNVRWPIVVSDIAIAVPVNAAVLSLAVPSRRSRRIISEQLLDPRIVSFGLHLVLRTLMMFNGNGSRNRITTTLMDNLEKASAQHEHKNIQ